MDASSNPFAPPKTATDIDTLRKELRAQENGDPVCVYRGLLEREVIAPGEKGWKLEYSGINFRQRIRLNGKTVWWCITWIWFQRFIHFRAPASPGQPDADWMVEVFVGRFLRIARFRVVINGQEVFFE